MKKQNRPVFSLYSAVLLILFAATQCANNDSKQQYSKLSPDVQQQQGYNISQQNNGQGNNWQAPQPRQGQYYQPDQRYNPYYGSGYYGPNANYRQGAENFARTQGSAQANYGYNAPIQNAAPAQYRPNANYQEQAAPIAFAGAPDVAYRQNANYRRANSRAYSDPYGFSTPQQNQYDNDQSYVAPAQVQNSDNEHVFSLPSEFLLH